MSGVSRVVDRLEVTFDEPGLVANAGLVLLATLTSRLGIEALVDAMVRLGDRAGGARPGRKLLTLVHALAAGGSHIDHVDMLRAGATSRVLGHRVMAPSTVGTWLRAFSFGHVRQLEAAVGVILGRAWALGGGPGDGRLVVDIDSTDWVTIAYPAGGEAQVAGTVYGGRRLIVRRTRLLGPQGQLWPDWRHFAFLTDQPGMPVHLDAFHRQHAVVELAIRDLKAGAGLTHVPSASFAANGAWLQAAVLAHNLLRWTELLGTTVDPGVDRPLVVARSQRVQLIAVPARLVNHAGRMVLRMPARWPWAADLTARLHRLRALPAPAG